MSESQPFKNRCVSYLLWLALLLLAGFVGYQQIFSTFAKYDDEGYVMISLRSFMNGHPLYDETFSQYGPAFYLVEGSLQRLIGLPITHDVVRLKTIAKWLMVAGACAWFVMRLTRRDGSRFRPLGILTFCLVFLHLDRLCLEPGHPQELCALGIAACLMLSIALASENYRKRLIASAMLGLVCATLLLTKLNVGLFLTVSVGSSLVLLLPDSRLKKVLTPCLYGGLAALPLLLYRHHLLEIHSALLAFTTALAGIAIVYACQWQRLLIGESVEEASKPTGWKPISNQGFTTFLSFAIAGLLTVAAVIGWSLASGTSSDGLMYGLIKQHTGFQQNFFHQPPVSAALVAIGAVLVAYGRQSKENAFYVAGLVVLGCLVAYLTETWRPLEHGLETRGRADLLMSVGPGLLVLLTIGSRPTQEFVPRLFLALISLLQPLAGYPTPGTQTAVGSFGFIIVCILLLNDGLRALPTRAIANSFQIKALGALVAVAVCILATRSVVVANYRSGLEPLALPGAQRLRLEKDFVEEQQWLVSQLRERADTFVFGEQGLNCLYFWSEIEPPTAMNTTFWPFILRESDQQRVIKALDAFPNACVTRTDFDARLPRGPLSEYIDQNFCKAAARGDTEIWVRSEHANEPTVQVGSSDDSSTGL